MITTFRRAIVLMAVCACAASAHAQEPRPADVPQMPVLTQTPQKASGTLTRAYIWAETRIDGASPASDGLFPEFGGIIPGGGLSAGPGYRHRLFGDRAIVRASAAVSPRRYTMMRSDIEWPQLLHHRLSLGGQVKYQDFTQINFFGIGSRSLKSDRTDYRLKDLDALAFGTVRLTPWLSVTGRAGVLQRLAIDRGLSTLYPSTAERFDDSGAPGLTQQPNYVHADVAIDVNTLDRPGYPSSGGRYRASVATFHDRDLARYSFRRFEADAAQYVPLGRSVLAFRGRIDVSQTGPGQDVPFYLLPSLGGSNSLRGYFDYRFRDRDMLLMNAEYRWPILRRVDAAVFYDAGSVASASHLLSRTIYTDYGAGLRLHSATRMLVRLDVARGAEGTRALVSFSTPLALPNRTVAPYVP
jgi:outer membrane protein assembly factor BamA